MKLPSSRAFSFVFAGLLAAAIAVSYSNSLGIGFLFDDSYGIANNPEIRSLRNLGHFFTNPYATNPNDNTQGGDLRPILFVSYAINYAVSGLQPWSYHVVNLLLHFAAALLVFIIVRDHLWWPPGESGASDAAHLNAAAAALFFALAPLNTQPVVYLWARSALLCVSLYLGAFAAFLRRRWALASLLYALALLTKAIAITLPVTLLVYDFLYRDRKRYAGLVSYARAWRRLILPVGIPAMLSITYVLYRIVVIPGWAGQGMRGTGATPWTWFVSQWPALLYYVRLFLWPDRLSADHDFPWTTSALEPRAYLSALVLLAWIVLALLAAKRHPQVTFATLWFFITLAPESSFAPLAEVINDHRPYIASSLGLSVLLTWLLYQATTRFGPRGRAVFVVVSVGLCIAAIPVIRHRNWEWQESLRLWESTVRASPNNGRAWMNAGLQHMARGEFQEARRYFQRARQLTPLYAYVYMNLSVLEAAEGHLEAALHQAEEAVRLRPDLSITHYYLGNALEKLGRADGALAAYQEAIKRNPNDTDARNAIARLTKGQGPEERLMHAGLYALYTRHDPAAAAAEFRQVLARNPTHYGATFQLAMALDRAGKADEARPVWEKMLAMAEAAKDSETLNTVRTRLAQQQP